MPGQGTPATALLAARQVPHTLHRYEVPVETPDYGPAVAAALGRPPAQVFKTLVAEVDRALVAAVLPVTGSLDLKALARTVGADRRARLAERAVAERATGYVRGGISPLGQRRALPVVLDATAGGLDLIYVSAGRRGLQIALAPADLVRLTGATLAPIAR